MKKKLNLTVKWTNWTFGFWWDTKKLHSWGIDLGPVEFMYVMTYRKKHFRSPIYVSNRHQGRGYVDKLITDFSGEWLKRDKI